MDLVETPPPGTRPLVPPPRPATTQAPHNMINQSAAALLGGRHPDGLRRAVRHGTGWMGPGGASTADFGNYVRQIRQFLEEEGRDPSQFTIAKRAYIAVEDDRVSAERRIRDRFERYSKNGDKGCEVSVYGTAEDVAAGIQEVIELGAQLVVLNPLYDFVAQQEALLEIIKS